MAAAADDTALEIAAWRGLVRVQGAVHRELDARLQAAVTFSWSASAPIGPKVDPAASDLVTVDCLLADGGGGFTVLTEETDRVGGGGDLDAFIAYLTADPGITRPTPDRTTPLP